MGIVWAWAHGGLWLGSRHLALWSIRQTLICTSSNFSALKCKIGEKISDSQSPPHQSSVTRPSSAVSAWMKQDFVPSLELECWRCLVLASLSCIRWIFHYALCSQYGWENYSNISNIILHTSSIQSSYTQQCVFKEILHKQCNFILSFKSFKFSIVYPRHWR